MGKILGGGLLDLGRLLAGNDHPFIAFSFVFTLEILVTALAIFILGKVSIKRFKEETKVSMESLFMAELDN